VKSHTPECVKIEQFAATLAPVKSYLVCVQDFDTKDYTLEIQGRSITVTREQFDDGTWQDIIRNALGSPGQLNVVAQNEDRHL
jgi:hypothetical protein